MASLPVPFRRRRSKATETIETIAKAWTALNLASAGSKAAKKGAKAYGARRGRRSSAGPWPSSRWCPSRSAAGCSCGARPAAARRAPGATSPSVTPAAHASTVSPPAGDSTGALTDPPAGAVNPPVGPRAAT